MEHLAVPELNFLSKKYLIILSILSLIGAGIIIFATQNYGVGVSPDSVTYLSVAKQFAAGQSTDLTISPPLYPAVLALISRLLKMAPLSSARVLNAVLFCLTIFLSGIIYKRYLSQSLFFNIIGIFTVIVSVPLIPVFIMAWTEPLFIILVLLYLIFFDLYSRKKNKVFLLLFSLSVALACLTRYIGVVLILTGIISIFLLKKKQLKTKFLDSFYFVLVSSIPIAIWIIRNYLISGTLTGARSISTYSYWQIINSAIHSLLGWCFPDKIQNLFLFAVIFLIIGFLIGIYYKEIWVKEKPDFSWQFPYIILIAIYILFLVASSKTAYWQLIDNRFLSPIFIPLNLLLLFYLQEVTKPFGLRLGVKKANYLISVLLMVWLIFPGIKTGNAILNQINMGKSYTSKSWRNSETVKYFANNLSYCTVYSNGADAIQFITGKTVYSVPLKMSGASVVASLSTLKNDWPNEKDICVVWFNQITWRSYYFTPEELISIADLRDEVRLNDGTIYFLSKINQ